METHQNSTSKETAPNLPPADIATIRERAGQYGRDLSRQGEFASVVKEPHYLGDCVAPYYATFYRRGSLELGISYHQVKTPWELKDMFSPREILRSFALNILDSSHKSLDTSKLLLQVISHKGQVLAAKPIGFVIGATDEAAHPQQLVCGGMTFTDSYDRQRRMGNIHFGPFPLNYDSKNILELTRRLHREELYVPGSALKAHAFTDPKIVER